MAPSLTWTTSCMILLALAPARPCQLFSGLRLPSLASPLSNLFSGPGGNPDSDVTNGRAALKDDRMPDLVPRSGPPQQLTMYRNAPPPSFQPMGDGFLYFPRHQASIVPAFMPQQGYHAPRLAQGFHQQQSDLRVPETRVQLRRRPLVPEDIEGDISGLIRRTEVKDEDSGGSLTGEDRLIAAIKLFKRLRTMPL